MVDLSFCSPFTEGKEEGKGFFGGVKEVLLAHLLKVVEVCSLCYVTRDCVPNACFHSHFRSESEMCMFSMRMQ